ncbi:adhesion G protein-coupled receptor L3-like isoform X2 [Rhopilema esculentum]|uniref:adhesion G protein-coupled receptor L3-like isoform X2 n=1 Tax=Rhopilema esculentum TaxID=499914 RepID=UPI0031D0AD8D
MRTESFVLLLFVIGISEVFCSTLHLNKTNFERDEVSGIDSIDIGAFLNDTAGDMLKLLLGKYPKFMEITAKVVNATTFNNTESLDEEYLCRLIISQLIATEDSCRKIAAPPKWCEDTALNVTAKSINGSSLQQLCSNVSTNATTSTTSRPLTTTATTTTLPTTKIATTTKITPTLINITDFTGIPPIPVIELELERPGGGQGLGGVGGQGGGGGLGSSGPMPPPLPEVVLEKGTDVASTYFFAAIQVIARTTINVFEKQKVNAVKTNGTTTNNLTTIVYTVSRVGSDNRKYSILSDCGNSLSLVGIILLLLEYGLCKQRLSLFERNIVSLCCTLFVSHGLQLLLTHLNDVRYFCKAGGVLLHWALMASFMWMLTISYDIFKTFRGMHHVGSDRSSRRFKKYVIFVAMSATTIVLLCVFLGIPKEDFSGYGYQGKCFVAKFWANLFAFIVPVALVLLTNTMLMISTLVKLRSLQKKSKKMFTTDHSKNVSSRRKVVISVLMLKLSILFGLGWLFGFIANAISSNVLMFLFVAMASLQGFLVFLCFGCHKDFYSKFCQRQQAHEVHVPLTTKSQQGTVTETSEVP